jgi:methylenetetrahydrofolate reductase (NADPH)
MSGIKPARRWQPAFYPFKREKFVRRILAKAELSIKGPLFGCRMCGNCLLQETALICPMECPKGLRNGPCGNITLEKNCYIDETRKCVWYNIYRRALKTGRQETLLEVLPPLDWNKTGTGTWSDVARQIIKTGAWKFITGLLIKDKVRKEILWDNVFRKIRQPDWWQGDSEFHQAKNIKSVSGLQKALMDGEFVVTTEVTPPHDTKTVKLIKDIKSVSPFVNAVNFMNSSAGKPKMSSLVCSKVANDNNTEPVYQIVARDITRNSLQSIAVGLKYLGIRNILCLTGDSPVIGPPPTGNMNFFDIDSVQMLWILRRMRDDGIYLDGSSIKEPPELFLGAATTPFASDPELQAIKDHKKVNAGAQFFQTNIIFDPDRLDLWLEQLDKRNILGKIFILIGIAPLKNYKTAKYLNERLPGVRVPEKIMSRMVKAGESGAEEGVQIALEMIDRIKDKKGVNGIHIMTMGWESIVQRIVTESGLDNHKVLKATTKNGKQDI